MLHRCSSRVGGAVLRRWSFGAVPTLRELVCRFLSDDGNRPLRGPSGGLAEVLSPLSGSSRQVSTYPSPWRGFDPALSAFELPTDGGDMVIPSLAEYLGKGQAPQTDRFVEDRIVIYDTYERVVARWQLRSRLRSPAKISYRGLGGGGKSHNLLRFVAEQRAAGNCVAYIHDCRDLLALPHVTVADVLTTALQAFARPTQGGITVAARQHITSHISRLEEWAWEGYKRWEEEESDVLTRIFLPVRKITAANHKKFIVVIDQEDRIRSPRMQPNRAVEWAQMFVSMVQADMVVVSAGDDSEGHQARQWDEVVQLPSPMPIEFAVTLLRQASKSTAGFGNGSEELEYLISHIGTLGGLAPLEVGKVCVRLKNSRSASSSSSTEATSLRTLCRQALTAFSGDVERMHHQLYDACIKEGDASYLRFLRAMAALLASHEGAPVPTKYIDRRFCALVDNTEVVFASPLAKETMRNVLRDANAEYFNHIDHVDPLFGGDWYEMRVFDRFLSAPNLVAKMFTNHPSVLCIPRGHPMAFLTSNDAFDVMKRLRLFNVMRKADGGEHHVVVLRPADATFPNIDGILISSYPKAIEVYFLQTAIDPLQEDTYQHFRRHDFPEWVKRFSSDEEASKVDTVMFSYVWVTNTPPEAHTNPRRWKLRPKSTALTSKRDSLNWKRSIARRRPTAARLPCMAAWR